MAPPLTFGVYPYGLAGGPDGLAQGPPDDHGRIRAALDELAGEGPALVTRVYVGWKGRASAERALAEVEVLARSATPIELAVSYRDPAGDAEGWADFIAHVVATYGDRLDAVQVTGEANLTDVPDSSDGAYPRVMDALVGGVVRAGAAKERSGATAAIGFAVSPELDPGSSPFWTSLAQRVGPAFVRALDYVGLDMYPDVFGPPMAPDRLDGAVDWLLRGLRERAFAVAGIGPEVAIRVSESGWPTGPDRPEERQAEVLEAVLRAVDARRGELHVTHWELFALRDADTSQTGLFHHFGVLRDDYTPKPAFDRLRRVMAELRSSR